MAILRWLTARQPSTVLVLALILGPAVGMAFLSRWRIALLYLFGSLALFCTVLGLADLTDARFDALSVAGYALLALHVGGALHCAFAARGRDAPPRWYGTWPAIILLWIALPATAAVLVRSFVAQPFEIPAASMLPALEVGDTVLADKRAYGYNRFSSVVPLFLGNARLWPKPARPGDVVVLRGPRDPQTAYAKRVVAGPGDRVQMRGGILHLNGEPVALSAPEPVTLPDGTTATQQIETLPGGASYPVLSLTDASLYDETPEVTVPADHYFVLGDNRDNSIDSRAPNIGMVPANHLVGRLGTVLWNAQRNAFILETVAARSERAAEADRANN